DAARAGRCRHAAASTRPLRAAPMLSAAPACLSACAPRLRPVAAAQPFLASRLPPTILVQVPAGTAIQASAWASFFAVPAQEEVAVWQSFFPALAMPKHFSVLACARASLLP